MTGEEPTVTDSIPEIQSIDRSQWKPDEVDLCYHLVNFARLANSVITEPGPLQGWFSEALWRQYSYAPFNARVMENYYSLAFFYGYDAPWNAYYRSPDVLRRLELVLGYTFDLMGGNGAIPEYAPADLDAPMLAPSSFGMEYMAAALEVAGHLLPDALKGRTIDQARKAAVYVLTSEESWAHARSFTNQFLGAMAGGLRLARLTQDAELRAIVERALPALLEEGHFMSPMGFLYEHDGPETFAYFFVTLTRLIPLYHESRDPRVREVLRRHCAWMSRWMLPEPDGEVLLAGSHQTRTDSAYRIAPRGARGLGSLLEEGDGPVDERRFLKLLLQSAESVAEKRAQWENDADLVATYCQRSLSDGYHPVPMSSLLPSYAPTAGEMAEAARALPCLDDTPSCQVQQDDRGNQYVFVREPAYYVGLSFGTHRSKARHGPGFLWLDEGGTLVLSENGDGVCWETCAADGGTGQALALSHVREGRGGHEVMVHYADMGFHKRYVFAPDGIQVLVSRSQVAGQALAERIPLLLRESDVIHLDYGRCLASGMSNRVLGVVTRTIGIERAGRRLLTLDLGAAISARLKPSYDLGGHVRAELTFTLPDVYFGRTGYWMAVGG